MLQYRSVTDLNLTILSSIHKIPADVDVVVGVARSGMLPATLLSLALNVPLAEMTSFSAGTILGSGKTRRVKRMNTGFSEVTHALIVDDSSDTGSSIKEARLLLAPLGEQMKLTFCAVYGKEDISEPPDVVLEYVPQPRIFEWNLLHHNILGRSCVDIDGILCFDPTKEENDDGSAYLNFLQTARPRARPTAEIGALVTSRLEKYRPQTELWLNKHGIRYKHLEMLDMPDAESRRAAKAHGTFKGRYYKSSQAELFIESEFQQANEIAKISGKAVLSFEGGVMCYPDDFSIIANLQRVRRFGRWDMARRLAAHSARRILGRHAETVKRLLTDR